MKILLERFWKGINTRLGFVLLLLFFYWIKTLWAYYIDLDLELENFRQVFLTLINPIPMGLLILGLGLYIKNSKLFYSLTVFLYIVLNLLLVANVIYFGEFTDFITVNTILASGSSAAGLGDSALNLLEISYLFYLIDLPFFIYAIYKKKLKSDKKVLNKRASFAVTALSGLLLSANLFIAETDRGELLTRGFSNNYIVRAMSIPFFTAYSGNQTYQAAKARSAASADDLDEVVDYVHEHYAQPNAKYYGIAQGRNVIMIHLESFQQFLIDYKLESDGQSYEVTPFLNSLYHSNSTISFSNFFNQVKSGKTSDAETLMENSLFGLSTGSYMVNYGGTNTAYAAPSILAQNGGYSSAVFHGNTGSFWNRNSTYKQWGYQYFFDSTAFEKQDSNNSFQYGLNDKYMFSDSIKYLEQLQQPFYVKYITVSNHYPYTSLSGDSNEEGFPLAKTKDETVNGYFATANYLDASIKAFFDYLKASGLYDNSIIVLYGDHYGISDGRSSNLAELLGKNSETWSNYDKAMLQRVPYMIHIPGYTGGFISDTYGGEVDALPTLLHILGVDTSSYIQMGQDLLSDNNNQTVALRTAGQYITPKYTSYFGKLYNTQTGEEITNPDQTTTDETAAIKEAVATQLSMSDAVQTGDLLRFYKDSGLNTVDASKISYTNQMKQLTNTRDDLGNKSTSVYSLNGNQTTTGLFNAPSYIELHPTNGTSSTSSSP
ncbi:LTA synthase family protein [Streptococcus dentiloxodontae]